MEEIDLIELLKRVKEGKAPKKIEIKNSTYIKSNDPDTDDIVYMYKGYSDYWLEDLEITLDTKIKILDKPIIEELKPVNYNNIVTYPDRDILTKKINEIIRVINNKE